MRVFRPRDGELVALALQIDDDPGSSIVNAAETLVQRIVDAFEAGDRLRVFVAFPNYVDQWTEVIDAVGADGPSFRRHLPHAEIAALVGQPVAMPEPGWRAFLPDAQRRRHLGLRVPRFRLAGDRRGERRLAWSAHPSRRPRRRDLTRERDAPKGQRPIRACFSVRGPHHVGARQHQRQQRPTSHLRRQGSRSSAVRSPDGRSCALRAGLLPIRADGLRARSRLTGRISSASDQHSAVSRAGLRSRRPSPDCGPPWS